MSNIIIKNISAPDLNFEKAKDIRYNVFILEQKVDPAEEYDEFEMTANHLLAFINDKAVGTSRYGLERIFRGFFDLLSVVFITRYAKKPMHLFGLLGLICCALGVSTLAYLSYRWTLGYGIGSRPLLTLGTLLTIVGLQFVSLGFIGEFLTYQHQKGQYVQKYPIRRRIEPS